MKLRAVFTSISLLLLAINFSHLGAQDSFLPPLDGIYFASLDQIQPVARIGRGDGNDIAWSPTGNTIAVASSLGVWLYDAHDLTTQSRLLEAGDEPTLTVTYSADGKWLAAGGDYVRVWDTETYELVNTIGTNGIPASMAFSPDGTRLAISNDFGSEQYVVGLWDVETGQLARVLQEQMYAASLNFSPDGSLLAGIWLCDCTIGVVGWEVETGEQVISNIPASLFAFSPDGQTIATSTDSGKVHLHDWRANTFTLLPETESTNESDEDDNQVLAYTQDGQQIISLIQQGKLQLWDVQASELTQAIDLGMTAHALSLSPDGDKVAIVNRSGEVGIWALASGASVTRTEEQAIIDGPIRFSPDGNLFAAGVWDDAWVWDTETGEKVLEVSGDESKITDLAFSLDGQLLAASSEAVQVWQIPNGDPVYTITADEPIQWIAFMEDDRLITVSRDTIQAWSSVTGEGTDLRVGNEFYPTIPSSTFDDYGISSFGYSPDGRMAISDGTGVIYLWQREAVDNPWLRVGGDFYRRQVNSITFMFDTLLTAGEDSVVQAWDAKTGEHRGVLTRHDNEIYGVAANPTGNTDEFIASAGCAENRRNPWEGSLYCEGADLRFWNVVDHLQVVAPQGHTQLIHHLVIRPDGKLVATASNDGTVILWGIPAAPTS